VLDGPDNSGDRIPEEEARSLETKMGGGRDGREGRAGGLLENLRLRRVARRLVRAGRSIVTQLVALPPAVFLVAEKLMPLILAGPKDRLSMDRSSGIDILESSVSTGPMELALDAVAPAGSSSDILFL